MHAAAHGNAGFRHFKLIPPALGPGGLREGPNSCVPPFPGMFVGTSQDGYQVEVLRTHNRGGIL